MWLTDTLQPAWVRRLRDDALRDRRGPRRIDRHLGHRLWRGRHPGGASGAGRRAPAAVALAAELSGLSEALWRCYTHPASAANSLAVSSDGWRRARAAATVSRVI